MPAAYAPVSRPFVVWRSERGLANHSAAATRLRSSPRGCSDNQRRASAHVPHAATTAISSWSRTTTRSAGSGCAPNGTWAAAQSSVTAGCTPLVGMVPAAVLMPWPSARFRATVSMR